MHWFINQSMARPNKKGANTQPCLTPNAVRNGRDNPYAVRTSAVVPVWRSRISRKINVSVPSPFNVFHNVSRSTESKAAFRPKVNIGHMQCCLLKVRCTCDSGRRASWASMVDRPGVKPDCCSLWFLLRRGCRRANNTWAMILVGIYYKQDDY